MSEQQEKKKTNNNLKPVIDYFLQGVISLDPSSVLELKEKKSKISVFEDMKYIGEAR